jgi:pimeloyl-ACP methyl ester carboxylesterase
MNTSSSSRVVNNVILHVEETGPTDGPLLILLHGFPGFWWDWRYQIDTLAAEGYRVVVPDMRGYNLSEKPEGIAAYTLDVLAADVAALAASYGRTTFRLVGHDWGGIVAWWTAITYPQRVESLAILNAPHPGVWSLTWKRNLEQAWRSLYVAFFQLPIIPELVLKAFLFALLRRMLVRSSQPGTFGAAEIESYVETWSRPDAFTPMLNYYRAIRYRRREPPARVSPPTLILWGARDTFLIPDNATAALDLCDNGEIVWLDEATHWLQMEEPEKVNATLARFFAAN